MVTQQVKKQDLSHAAFWIGWLIMMVRHSILFFLFHKLLCTMPLKFIFYWSTQWPKVFKTCIASPSEKETPTTFNANICTRFNLLTSAMHKQLNLNMLYTTTSRRAREDTKIQIYFTYILRNTNISTYGTVWIWWSWIFKFTPTARTRAVAQ